jgi:hypothetical protein
MQRELREIREELVGLQQELNKFFECFLNRLGVNHGEDDNAERSASADPSHDFYD